MLTPPALERRETSAAADLLALFGRLRGESRVGELELSSDVSSFDGALAKACARAKVKRFTARHLRHTFACEVLRAGAELRQVQAWMGHASITTTERYLHFIRPTQPPAPV